jgi:hypothetical protein
MFKTNQIISATHLVRNFKRISWHLSTHPEALLITQKKGEHLVLLNAEIFEDLLEFKLKMDISSEELVALDPSNSGEI